MTCFAGLAGPPTTRVATIMLHYALGHPNLGACGHSLPKTEARPAAECHRTGLDLEGGSRGGRGERVPSLGVREAGGGVRARPRPDLLASAGGRRATVWDVTRSPSPAGPRDMSADWPRRPQGSCLTARDGVVRRGWSGPGSHAFGTRAEPGTRRPLCWLACGVPCVPYLTPTGPVPLTIFVIGNTKSTGRRRKEEPDNNEKKIRESKVCLHR